jgi:hypothetical protein
MILVLKISGEFYFGKISRTLAFTPALPRRKNAIHFYRGDAEAWRTEEKKARKDFASHHHLVRVKYLPNFATTSAPPRLRGKIAGPY